MSDPITAAATVISEHPQAIGAIATAYGLVKPFLVKIIGPGAEEIGEIGRDFIKGRRAKNTERTLSDAEQHLADVGREAQPVPLDLVVPLIESASLQEDPALSARWSALLANAADPAKNIEVKPAYIDILRQLSPSEALLLDKMFQIADANNPMINGNPVPYPPENQPYIRQEVIMHSGVVLRELGPASNDYVGIHAFIAMVDNLIRHRLVIEEERSLINQEAINGRRQRNNKVFFTALGVSFMLACNPPLPASA